MQVKRNIVASIFFVYVQVPQNRGLLLDANDREDRRELGGTLLNFTSDARVYDWMRSAGYLRWSSGATRVLEARVVAGEAWDQRRSF